MLDPRVDECVSVWLGLPDRECDQPPEVIIRRVELLQQIACAAEEGVAVISSGDEGSKTCNELTESVIGVLSKAFSQCRS